MAYLRRLVGERAREDYSALVENTGESGQQGCLTSCNELLDLAVREMLGPLYAATAGCWMLDALLPDCRRCHAQSPHKETLLSCSICRPQPCSTVGRTALPAHPSMWLLPDI